MSSENRKNLFQMVLKAAPYGGFVFEPLGLERPGEFSNKIKDSNNKMQQFLTENITEEIEDLLQESLNFPHPAIFPVKHTQKNYFLVVLPIMDNPLEGERLCLLVHNEQDTPFTPPLLKENSWHEINNPLAIISLTLQKVFKKETLDQGDIDTLLERINSCFTRIETFITGQIEMSRL